jgi:uncharacterized membrane protein AbrB (regulator of aidB expression)
MSGPSRVSTNLLVSALVGIAASYAGLYLFGWLVGTLPNPPRWVSEHAILYVYSLRLVVWLPIVLLCALIVSRTARSKSAVFGVIAGGIAMFALLAQLFTIDDARDYTFGYVATTYWLELVLVAGLIPLVSVLWRPRGA